VRLTEAVKPLNGQPLTEETINAVAAAVVQEVETLGFSMNGAADQLVAITRAAFKTCRHGDCS
jgi:CO/xanthine dehydrogenase FAD-binding subunit